VIDHGVERKSYSEGRIFDLSRQTGRSPPTLRRWARQGVDLDDPEALKEFLERMDSRKPAFDRTKKRNFSRVRNRPVQNQLPSERAERHQDRSEPAGNGETPVERTVAQFALKRLELEEAQAFAGLQRALAAGNQLEVEQCQLFWVRLVESLRKLDLSIEIARRDAEMQVPLKTAENAVLTAERLRIALAQFLSSETTALMAFKDGDEFRAYFIERFRGILDLAVKNADKTNSPIPS